MYFRDLIITKTKTKHKKTIQKRKGDRTNIQSLSTGQRGKKQTKKNLRQTLKPVCRLILQSARTLICSKTETLR